MDLVQVLPNALKCPCVSIKHALKKQGIKTPKPLISQGFQVSVSILVTQDGCGGRTRTYGLRVMRLSQVQIGVVSAPICAFCHRSLGGFSIVSVQPCPLFSDSGSKLGQRRFCNYKPQVVGHNILSTCLMMWQTNQELTASCITSSALVRDCCNTPFCRTTHHHRTLASSQ